MNHQRVLLREATVTPIALERLLAVVNALVANEQAIFGELLAAVLTAEHALSPWLTLLGQFLSFLLLVELFVRMQSVDVLLQQPLRMEHFAASLRARKVFV